MIKTIIAISILSVLAGCVFSSVPKENSDFSRITSVNQFKGIYKNAGEPKGYLSQIIWANKHTVGNFSHKEIEIIEVSSTDRTLTVNAIKDGCIVYSKEYVLNNDFKLTNGRIVLRSETHLLTRGGDDVILGPSYEKVELGLDVKGNGKFKSQDYIAGMVFMLVPIAGSSTSEIRFIKLRSDAEYDICKESN